jgi:phosphonate transport system permease protein
MMAEVAPAAQDVVVSVEQACQALRCARWRRTCAGSALFLLTVAGSWVLGEVSIVTGIVGLPGFFNYLREITPTLHAHSVLQDVGEWYWGLGRWLTLLGDTVVMAFLGTLLGASGAFVLCFPASRTLTCHPVVYFLSRRVTEIARAVPELVYAMIFVFAFGLGPFPGVLAIAIHSMGALGKLFAEVNDNVDLRPMEGVQAAGANWYQMLRYAVVPQVLPGFLSYTLLRFEINVRAASVIGFVGAGGIGQELMFVIRQFVYTDISAIVLLIIVLVAFIDMGCEKLRHRVIGRENMR